MIYLSTSENFGRMSTRAIPTELILRVNPQLSTQLTQVIDANENQRQALTDACASIALLEKNVPEFARKLKQSHIDEGLKVHMLSVGIDLMDTMTAFNQKGDCSLLEQLEIGIKSVEKLANENPTFNQNISNLKKKIIELETKEQLLQKLTDTQLEKQKFNQQRREELKQTAEEYKNILESLENEPESKAIPSSLPIATPIQNEKQEQSKKNVKDIMDQVQQNNSNVGEITSRNHFSLIFMIEQLKESHPEIWKSLEEYNLTLQKNLQPDQSFQYIFKEKLKKDTKTSSYPAKAMNKAFKALNLLNREKNTDYICPVKALLNEKSMLFFNTLVVMETCLGKKLNFEDWKQEVSTLKKKCDNLEFYLISFSTYSEETQSLLKKMVSFANGQSQKNTYLSYYEICGSAKEAQNYLNKISRYHCFEPNPEEQEDKKNELEEKMIQQKIESKLFYEEAHRKRIETQKEQQLYIEELKKQSSKNIHKKSKQHFSEAHANIQDQLRQVYANYDAISNEIDALEGQTKDVTYKLEKARKELMLEQSSQNVHSLWLLKEEEIIQVKEFYEHWKTHCANMNEFIEKIKNLTKKLKELQCESSREQQVKTCQVIDDLLFS